MCQRRSEDQIEVCAVAAGDLRASLRNRDGVVVEAPPESGYLLVTNTVPERRAAFLSAIDEAARPYQARGAC